MKLGAQIKQIRKKKGFSQKQLAEQLGISANAMCNIEKGYSLPSKETVDEICQLLNVEVKLVEKEVVMIRKKTYVVTANVPDECNFEDVLKSAFAYGWVLEVKEIPDASDEEVELKLIEK